MGGHDCAGPETELAGDAEREEAAMIDEVDLKLISCTLWRPRCFRWVLRKERSCVDGTIARVLSAMTAKTSGQHGWIG